MKYIFFCSLLLISININAQNNVKTLPKPLEYDLSNNPNWFIEIDEKYIRKEKKFQENNQIGKEENSNNYFKHLCETESFSYKIGTYYYYGDNQDEIYSKINLNEQKNILKYQKIPFNAKYYELTRKIEREQLKKNTPFIIEGEESIIVKKRTNEVLKYTKNFSFGGKKCIDTNEYKEMYEIKSLNTLKVNTNKSYKYINLIINEDDINPELLTILNNSGDIIAYDMLEKNIFNSKNIDKKFKIKKHTPSFNCPLFLKNNNYKKWRQLPLNKNCYDNREIYIDLDIEPLAYLNMLTIEKTNQKEEGYLIFFEGKIKRIQEGLLLDFNLNPIDKNIYEKYYPLIPEQPQNTTFREYVMNDGSIFRITYDSKYKRYSPIKKVFNIESNRILKLIKVKHPLLEEAKVLMVNIYLYDKNTLELEMFLQESYQLPYYIKDTNE